VCSPLPPDSYVEILIPKVMVLRGVALGGGKVMSVEPPEWGQCPVEPPHPFLHAGGQLGDGHL